MKGEISKYWIRFDFISMNSLCELVLDCVILGLDAAMLLAEVWEQQKHAMGH